MRNGEETESIPENQQKFLHLLRRFMSKKGNAVVHLPLEIQKHS